MGFLVVTNMPRVRYRLLRGGDEGYESDDEDDGFIGTRSWLQSGTRVRLATELYRRFVPIFLVTNYALDWKASWSKKRVVSFMV